MPELSVFPAGAFPLGAFLASLPWVAAGLAVLLAVTFAVAVRQSRHSVIDTVWGLGFVVVAAISWFLSAGHGDGGRRLLLLALVAVWGIRLALHIGLRARGGHEDPRYVDMLSSAPGSRNTYALRKVYLPQGVILFFVSLTVQVEMFSTGSLGWLAWLGVVSWAVGFVFETVGDWQLAQFKDDPSRRGTVLNTGLWRYTRHPNYFGDAAVWTGIFLIAADSWPGVLTVLSPALMIRPPRLQGIRRIDVGLPAAAAPASPQRRTANGQPPAGRALTCPGGPGPTTASTAS